MRDLSVKINLVNIVDQMTKKEMIELIKYIDDLVCEYEFTKEVYEHFKFVMNNEYDDLR